MKWSMDTHKYISEITRKALQVLHSHQITSESAPEEIDAAERELGACGVYKDYDGAKGRIRRALFTYFKAYGCMDDNERLTELGTAFVENKLSVQELSFIYILNYKYDEDGVSYYPAQLLLTCLSKMREIGQSIAFLTAYDFKRLTEMDNVENITNDLVSSLIDLHSQETETVNERAIGFDVWAKMLVQAGILVRNSSKNLEPANWDLVDWILSAYNNGITTEKGKVATGVSAHIPYAPLNAKNGEFENEFSEFGAVQAFLFDGLTDRVISKYIIVDSMPINTIKSVIGLTEQCRGFYVNFAGLERVVGYALLKSNEASVKALGLLLLDMPIPETDITSVSFEPIFTPEWFKEKSADYPNLDRDASAILTEFQDKFSVEYLSSLSGIDLLNNIFLNGVNPKNLCRVLEFDTKNKEIFGSISGGTAYKYGLFFSSNGTWMTGSSRKPQTLSEDEAVVLGTKIRDRLVAGAKAIADYGVLETIEDYKKLYEILKTATEGDIDKVWFMKYYQMLYPSVFATNYSDFAQRTILGAIGEEKEKYAFVRLGQLRFFADKCGISNVMLNKIFWQYYSEEETVEAEKETSQDISFHTGYTTHFARNRILFGAPGTGKSYTINKEKNELLENGGEYERVTFHPDYSYANFVGTYKPVPFIDSDGKDAITYAYVPGPFMRTYVKALKNSRTPNAKPFLVIIEEINRANVAAVFGDVFQLLDRDEEEKSEYPIQATEDIKKYLAEELGGTPADYAEIRIPDNMFIWATMNSADQGVFPMDTAFKRRWDFTYLGIDDSEEGIVGKMVTLGKGSYERNVEWNELRKAINEELLTYKVNEDKLMGPYFISKKIMPEDTQIDTDTFIRVFKNKVIMYLFDDAAKQKRHSLFAGCDEKTRTQYSKICAEFDRRGVAIFCAAIKDRFIPEEQGEG